MNCLAANYEVSENDFKANEESFGELNPQAIK